MRKLLLMAVTAGLIFIASPMEAWFNGGHMVVAYIAYQNLTPKIRARVDSLVKKNKLYSTWTKGISKKQKGLAAFVYAATWPDCIKQKACSPGYTSDGGDTPPGDPSDAQNIGYSDMLMHRYWHFVDTPYFAGAPGQPPKVPNALTEIVLLGTAVGSSEADEIKSYDIVWLEHLVGDVHQPLHSTSRFTINYPEGDAGGNSVHFCAKPCTDELHAFWDGLLGDTPTFAMVTQTGSRLIAAGKPAGSDNLIPSSWISDSFDLAKSAAYSSPISDENDPAITISPRPDAAYQAKAASVANSQVALAGYRLAGLLNANLK